MIEYTIFLLALPALLLPFLLKLIKPPKPQKISFSQMAILEKVFKEFHPTKKKSPWLLYLIRMITMLLVILLVAGFLFKEQFSSQSVSALIFIDDSFYAQARKENSRNLWQEQIESLESHLFSLPVGSSVSLVGLSGTIVIPWTSPFEMTQKIGQLEATYSDEKWGKARRSIRRLVRSREHVKMEFLVVSEGVWAYPEEYSRVLETLPKEVSVNEEFTKSSSLENARLKIKVFKDGNSVIIKGEVNAQHLSRIGINFVSETQSDYLEVDLVEGKSFFTKTLNRKIFSNGYVELDIVDKYLLDNKQYYSLNAVSSLRIILLNHKQAEERLQDVSYYLRKGFRTIEAKSLASIENKDPQFWESVKGNIGDFIILHDPPFLSEKERDALDRFVKSGGQLLIFPGPYTPLDLLENNFGDKLPADLKEIVTTFQLVDFPDSWSKYIPRFSKTPLRGKWLFYRLNEDAQTLLRFEDGSPFWIKSTYGNGAYHLISSPFHIVWSDAVIMSDFPVLLEKMISFANPKWEELQEALVLEPGSSFPEMITSIRSVLADSKLSMNGTEVKPGLYACQLQNGEDVILTSNFSGDQVLSREKAQLQSRDLLGADVMNEWQRNDRFISFLLVIFLFLEAIYLLWKKEIRISNT